MAGISTVIERNEVYELRAPARQTLAGVFASPHSGTDYRPEFLTQSRLDPITLRRSEDAFVDEIFAAAPERGAPLLRALFPRAFIDPNREPWELDAAMFAEPLPNYVNSRSPRVAAGLGTIARVVANGEEIYGHKLDFTEAARGGVTAKREWRLIGKNGRHQHCDRAQRSLRAAGSRPANTCRSLRLAP